MIGCLDVYKYIERTGTVVLNIGSTVLLLRDFLRTVMAGTHPRHPEVIGLGHNLGNEIF